MKYIKTLTCTVRTGTSRVLVNMSRKCSSVFGVPHNGEPRAEDAPASGEPQAVDDPGTGEL